MNIITWCYEQIIGSSIPSPEVRRYVRTERARIAKLETVLAVEKTQGNQQAIDNTLMALATMRHNVSAYERLYPGKFEKLA